MDQNQLEGELLEGPALQNHTELRYLYANHNRLTAVPQGLPEGLRQLRLAYNRISSLGADAFQHLQHLTVLLLQGNRLQTVPSDSFTGTLLVCLFSSVSFVYVFVGFPYFLSVYCDSNLTDHSLHSDGSLASPPGLLALDLLDLGENRFKAVPAHLPPSLQQLYLSGNNFSELGEGSFAGLDRLKYLRLSRCGLRSPGVPRTAFNVSTLVELDLSYNRLAVTPTVPNSLQYLYLEANEIQGEAMGDTLINTHTVHTHTHTHTHTHKHTEHARTKRFNTCIHTHPPTHTHTQTHTHTNKHSLS